MFGVVRKAHLARCPFRVVLCELICTDVPATHYCTFIIFGKWRDSDSSPRCGTGKMVFFPVPIHLIVSIRSESIAKIYFSTIVPKHQFLAELLWDQKANSLWRLMVRKRSQIASFSLLHYLLLLSKTVLLMTSAHKSNLKHTSNKRSSERVWLARIQKISPSPLHTSDTERERWW